LLFSIGHPMLRACLYFMSFNTMQIYGVYRVIFKLKFLNPIIILGVYIAIISLFLYPFWVLFKLYYTIGV
jgi:hypothetical protein